MKIGTGIRANRKKESSTYKEKMQQNCKTSSELLRRTYKVVVVSELGVLTWTFHGETEERNENFQSGSWLLCRNLNNGPPVYEAGVLPTRPRQPLFNYFAGRMKHVVTSTDQFTVRCNTVQIYRKVSGT
jgi:hypothetical protein